MPVEADKAALIALDVGEARIGVACGQRGSKLAFGRGAITRGGLRQDIEAVRSLAAREGAATVVVGLPIRHDGLDSPQTQRVRAFARALEQAGLTVVLEDERFTTRLAGRQLANGSLPRGKRRQKERLDEAAAVLILESYLQRTAPSEGAGT